MMHINGEGNQDSGNEFPPLSYVTYQDFTPYVEKIADLNANLKMLQSDIGQIKGTIGNIDRTLSNIATGEAVKKLLLKGFFWIVGGISGLVIAHFIGAIKIFATWLVG